LNTFKKIFFRSMTCPPSRMRAPGVTFKDLPDGRIERAEADAEAVVIAFGDHFADPGADQPFCIEPEVGIHDFHMIKGNSGIFANDNRNQR
jgi:uncharacterized protein YukJ